MRLWRGVKIPFRLGISIPAHQGWLFEYHPGHLGEIRAPLTKKFTATSAKNWTLAPNPWLYCGWGIRALKIPWVSLGCCPSSHPSHPAPSKRPGVKRINTKGAMKSQPCVANLQGSKGAAEVKPDDAGLSNPGWLPWLVISPGRY